MSAITIIVCNAVANMLCCFKNLIISSISRLKNVQNNNISPRIKYDRPHIPSL